MYVHSKECSYLNQLFCNKVDHLEVLHTKQKSMQWSLAPITTPQAQVPKFRKPHNQYLVCPPFSLTYPCLTELAHGWVVSDRCIPCCHDRWHKSVTQMWRHKTPITTVQSYTQTLAGWSISLDASSIKHFAEVSYCLRRFVPTVRRPAACQYYVNVLTWFSIIKREKSILADVFSRHCQMITMHVQFQHFADHNVKC